MATPVAATLASRVIARRAGASSRRRRRGRRPLRVAAAVAEDAAASDADGAKKNDDDADPTRNQHLPPPARRTPRGVPPPITVAMKEWGAIVAALEAGEQTIVFRKGGLRDGDGGFELVARHFALFPTTYHPSERITEATPLRARARAFMETPTPDMKNGDAVPVTLIAECTGAWVTKDASVFEKLAAHHAWTPELLSARMKWKPEAPITILELRVKKLADEDAALTTLPPDVERYGGCRSWIDLPYAISVDAGEPVMNDGDFVKAREDVRDALKGVDKRWADAFLRPGRELLRDHFSQRGKSEVGEEEEAKAAAEADAPPPGLGSDAE